MEASVCLDEWYEGEGSISANARISGRNPATLPGFLGGWPLSGGCSRG